MPESARTKKLLGFYDQMLRIRRFEEAAAKAYAGGSIKGFCHLYIGEESIAVGAIANLEKQDYIISTYRDHGHALARGMEPGPVMAELYGKETGCSKGMGGSMHLFDKDLRFMGGHGIVGGHVAVAAGLAFGARYQKERNVTLAFIGEGAVSIGGFHEGLSLAALWKLPVVFIVENNLYSMGTPQYRHLSVKDISMRAEGYGMPGKRIDGSNVYHVYEEVREAVNRARSDHGPTLIEIITYRFRGHSMSDPAKYRAPGELELKKEKDPILVTHAELLSIGVSEDTLKAVNDKNKKIADDSVEFAKNSAFPPVSDLHKYTYVNP